MAKLNGLAEPRLSLYGCSMHRSFIPCLRCPITKLQLTLQDGADMIGDVVVNGVLTSGRSSYPVVRSIPRFVAFRDEGYADSFGKQWSRWSRVQFDSENVGKPMMGHTSMMFERIIGPTHFSSLRGKTLLDVGVGAGRFADVAVGRGAKVIGIDLSSAVEVARKNIADAENVLICQADALNLPLADDSIDGAYSIGVLHHTPDPFQGVREIFRTVKPSGWSAVAVYQKGGYYDSVRVRIWRSIFRGLAPFLGKETAPLFYAKVVGKYLYGPSFIPGIGHFIRAAFPMMRLPDLDWRILDTFDSLTPTYQSAHTAEEVRGWFETLQAEHVTQADWGTSTWRGLKGKKVPPIEIDMPMQDLAV